MRQLLTKRIVQPCISRRMAHAHVSEASLKMWRLATFGFVPFAVTATAVFVYQREKAHFAHYVRPEYKEYAHLGVRSKPFPWKDGNKSLFHNPKTNPLPGVGYEED